MRYHRYGTRDFVTDPFFQRWVLTHDTESDLFWRAWLNENPDKRFVVEEASRIIHLLGFTTDPEVNNKLLQTWQSLDVEGVQSTTHGRLSRHAFPSQVFRVAAAVALLIISAVSIWYIQSRTITIRTEFSEVKSVTLPDGSVIELNANSSIEYANNWDEKSQREVWLKGEAFFSVFHNSEKEFLVHTADGIDVRVLGTTFNMMTRRNTTRVSLNTGRIEVRLSEKFLTPDSSNAGDGFIMLPGEVAEFDMELSSVRKHVAGVDRYASWKDGQMVFDNTAMQDIALMLHDTHGLRVFLDEPLKMRRITGAFRSDDIDILIQFIARALNAEVHKESGEIHFKSKNSKQ